MVVDGTLIPIDRVAADRPFYSGKHKRHGMNLQVIASPCGDILWVSGALPGSVHDKKAEWIWGILAELEAAGLVTLADKGYQGSSYAKIPYRAIQSSFLLHAEWPAERYSVPAHEILQRARARDPAACGRAGLRRRLGGHDHRHRRATRQGA